MLSVSCIYEDSVKTTKKIILHIWSLVAKKLCLICERKKHYSEIMLVNVVFFPRTVIESCYPDLLYVGSTYPTLLLIYQIF